MEEKTNLQRYWVGIDWGSEKHAVSIVDDRGIEQRHFAVFATLEGLEVLDKTLRDIGMVAGVAIEATNNPVFYYLLERDYTIYPVNPKTSKRWREGNSVAGVKSDVRDGLVLAAELARRHETQRVFQPEDPQTAKLRGLCEKQRTLIDHRTALVQQIRQSLACYYPAALEFFSDLTAPTVWAFLKRFPNPQELAKARKDTLLRFLKGRRIGLTPLWMKRIEQRVKATDWPLPPTALAEQLLVLACVVQLQALQSALDKMQALIEELIRPLPEAKLVRSLPGAGPKLTPALTAIIHSAAARADNVQALRCLSGVAPVQEQSGKRNRTRIRRRCNKYLRNILHLYAWCSTRACLWAKAYYELCKERGDSHATALRKLADKWLRIIYRMLQTGQPYEDSKYLKALRKTHSPIWERICGLPCA